MESISADEARRMFLRAQGFIGPADRAGGVPAMLSRVGAVQLDTISVLARSHELVAYARLGPVGRAAVEQAYWGEPHQAFEYWGHAMSVMPVEQWPWLAWRRRWFRNRWAGRPAGTTSKAVMARLAEGPVTTADVGGAKRGGEWWDWSDAKSVLERLLAWGEVVCVERKGWRRVYDLAARVMPEVAGAPEPSDDECHRQLVVLAARHLGVGTVGDLADYYRLKKTPVRRSLSEGEGLGLVQVAVQGWAEPAWADPGALAALSQRGRHRTTLLSPFDSLVWDRARTLRMFGMDHRLEAYVPKPKRVLGYFVMPVLAGGRLVARVDPKRSGKTFVAQQVTYAGVITDRVRADVAAAMAEAAEWVGCDNVVVEREVVLAEAWSE